MAISGLSGTLRSLEYAFQNGELTKAQALVILNNILKNAVTNTDKTDIQKSIDTINKVTTTPKLDTTKMIVDTYGGSISGLSGTLRALELAVKNGELTKAQALVILNNILKNAVTNTDKTDIQKSIDTINNLPPVITLECTVDSQCKSGYICVKNKCVLYVPPPPPPPPPKECSMDSQCSKGYYCSVDGYCIKLPDFTTKPCSSDAECTDGYTCKDGVCVPISQVYAGCLLAFSFNALFLLTGVDLNSILPWIRTNIRAHLPRWFVKKYYQISKIVILLL